jgi:hypothetical protein
MQLVVELQLKGHLDDYMAMLKWSSEEAEEAGGRDGRLAGKLRSHQAATKG